MRVITTVALLLLLAACATPPAGTKDEAPNWCANPKKQTAWCDPAAQP